MGDDDLPESIQTLLARRRELRVADAEPITALRACLDRARGKQPLESASAYR